jgi:hypothetical protein
MKLLSLLPLALLPFAFLLAQLTLTERDSVRPIRDTTGNYYTVWGVASFRQLRVYRNGLRQAPAVDYDLTGNKIIPKPTAPWAADDIILVDYVQ